jgi:heme-degrading monooxygenase HmoA
MIVRIWHARATDEGAESYRHHFEENVLPELRRIHGFRKAYLLTRAHDNTVDIAVHTMWDSPEAVKGFAAADMDRAVIEPQAKAVLSSYDEMVTHFAAIEYPA